MPAPVFDQTGTSTSTGGTTTTISVTSAAARIILVFTTIGASATGPTPTLSIAGAGLTWTSLTSIAASNSGGVFFTLQGWWAYTSGAVSAQTVTITSSTTIDDAASVYGTWSGAVAAAPLDPNASSRFALSSSAQPIQGAVTTTLSNDVTVFATGTNSSTAASGATGGATGVNSASNGGGARYAWLTVFQLAFTTPQTARSVGFSLNTVPSGLIAATLTADAVAATTQARAMVLA